MHDSIENVSLLVGWMTRDPRFEISILVNISFLLDEQTIFPLAELADKYDIESLQTDLVVCLLSF